MSFASGLTAGRGWREQYDTRDDDKDKREFEKDKRNQERDSMNLMGELQNELAPYYQAAEDNPSNPMAKGTGIVSIPKQDNAPMSPVQNGLSKESPTKRFQLTDINKLHDIYQKYTFRAATNPYAAKQLKPALDSIRSIGLAQHSETFDGDKFSAEGSLRYAKYMAEGAGRFGNYMTAEQAKAFAKETDTFDSESYEKALSALHRGNGNRAIKLFNSSGRVKGQLANVRPTKFNLGGQVFNTYEGDFTDSAGNTRKINAMAMMFSGQALKSQVDMYTKAMKASDDHRRTVAGSREILEGDTGALLVDKYDASVQDINSPDGSPITKTGKSKSGDMNYFGYKNQKQLEDSARSAIHKLEGIDSWQDLELDDDKRNNIAQKVRNTIRKYIAAREGGSDLTISDTVSEIYSRQSKKNKLAPVLREQAEDEAKQIGGYDGPLDKNDFLNRGYKSRKDFIEKRTKELKAYTDNQRELLERPNIMAIFDQARAKPGNDRYTDEQIRKSILKRIQ